MASKSKAEIVRGLFAAYWAQDRKAAEDLVADNFTFTSPYDDAIGKAAYFERCFPTRDFFKEQVLERVCVDGDGVFALYRCLTREGKQFQNVEYLTVAADRITSVSVYFGASYKDGVLQKA